MIISKQGLKERLRTSFAAKGLKSEDLDKLTDIIFPKFTQESTDEQDSATISELSPFVDMMQSAVERVRTARVQTTQTKEENTGEQAEGAGSSANSKNQNDNNDQETPQWVKAITSRLDKLEGDRIVGGRKSQLDKVLEGLTDAQRKVYGRIKLDAYSDDEFNAEIESISAEAEELRIENAKRGVTITPPRVQGGVNAPKASDKAVDAVVDKMNI